MATQPPVPNPPLSGPSVPGTAATATTGPPPIQTIQQLPVRQFVPFYESDIDLTTAPELARGRWLNYKHQNIYNVNADYILQHREMYERLAHPPAYKFKHRTKLRRGDQYGMKGKFQTQGVYTRQVAYTNYQAPHNTPLTKTYVKPNTDVVLHSSAIPII